MTEYIKNDYNLALGLRRGIETSLKTSLAYFTTIEYEKLRRYFLSKIEYLDLIPELIRANRTLNECKIYLRNKKLTQESQISHLNSEFKLLLDYIEFEKPKQVHVKILFDERDIQTEWQKCIDRKITDPKGAITSARTLLESMLKYILSELKVPYKEKDDIIDLYKSVAAKLNLAPQQGHETFFKQILSGTHSIVQGIGTMRNKLSDAHAHEPDMENPIYRHSEFAVNIAGATALFLYKSYKEIKITE